jgi:hypothetical protein
MRKATTVHFDAELLNALRIHAATGSESMSDYVNRAVREQLAEDLELHERTDSRLGGERERAIPLEKALQQLRSRGLL